MIRILPSLLALLLLARTTQAESEADIFFETRIRPVLAGTCFKCHGGNKVNAELRVDTRQALVRGGQSGPALAPGAPERSLLIQALRHAAQSEIKMPPNQKLPDSTIADFERWVKQGAIWPAAAPGSMPSRPASTGRSCRCVSRSRRAIRAAGRAARSIVSLRPVSVNAVFDQWRPPAGEPGSAARPST